MDFEVTKQEPNVAKLTVEIRPQSKFGKQIGQILKESSLGMQDENDTVEAQQNREDKFNQLIHDVLAEIIPQTGLILIDTFPRGLSIYGKGPPEKTKIEFIIDHIEDIKIPDWKLLKKPLKSIKISQARTDYMENFLLQEDYEWETVNGQAQIGDRVDFRFRLNKVGSQLVTKKTVIEDSLFIASEPQAYLNKIDSQLQPHLLNASPGDKKSIELKRQTPLGDLPFVIDLKVDAVERPTETESIDQLLKKHLGVSNRKKFRQTLKNLQLITKKQEALLDLGRQLLSQLISEMTCSLPEAGVLERQTEIAKTVNHDLSVAHKDDLVLEVILESYQALECTKELIELDIKQRLVVAKILEEAKINVKDEVGQKQLDPKSFYFYLESDEAVENLTRKAILHLAENASK